MEALTQVKLLSLEPYRHLFPKARAIDQTEKKGAGVSDTVAFIPKIVERTAWQVEKFVAQELKGLPRYQACEKLWNFVKYHIQYEKDERGLEQVRSPRRLIHDAKGDCDCFTTFIDTCLFVLKIPVINRITKYKQDYFQHIYPIVPIGNGKYITMDCVVNSFNYEEPFTVKKDYPMDLQFLDGIEDDDSALKGVDAQDLFGQQGGMGELGKLFKKRNAEKSAGAPTKKITLFKKKSPEQKQAAKQKHQNFGKKTLKVVNKVNKVNPATILLRAGILASMKLNVMKVAERIKWGYASKEFAQSKGMDMSKYDKVKNVLTKTEQIFFAAGGKPENLKKSILTGHGNKNHEVQGIEGLSENTPLNDMLGIVYQDEFVSGMEGFDGFGELGEPATATALAAASTTMGTLALLLKSIGDLFPKRNKDPKTKKGLFKKKTDNSAPAENTSDEGGSENAEPSVETNSEEETPSGSETEIPSEETPSQENEENLPATVNEETEVAPSGGEENTETPESTEETTEGILSGTSIGMGIKAFWLKNKKWIVPVGVIAAGVTAVLVISHFASDSEDTKTRKPKQRSLNGTPRRKHKTLQRKGGHAKSHHQQKSLIALM